MIAAILAGIVGAAWHAGTAAAQMVKFEGVEAVTVADTPPVSFPRGVAVSPYAGQGVLWTFDPRHPQNGATADCSGTFTNGANGDVLGKGACSYTARDGSLLWVRWEGDDQGGIWVYDGGTGKFDGVKGSGTYTRAAAGNGVAISHFTGQYELKK